MHSGHPEVYCWGVTLHGTPLINYVIASRRDESWSQFQYFSIAWLELYQTLAVIIQGPTSFADIVAPLADRVKLRIYGIEGFRIVVIDPESLKRIPPIPFMVLVTTADTDDIGRTFCASRSDPVLHLPTNAHTGEVSLFDASHETFMSWHGQVLRHFETTDNEMAAAIHEYMADLKHRAPIPTPSRTAFLRAIPLTLPNDLAIKSIQYPHTETSTEAAESELDLLPLIERSYRQVKELRAIYIPQGTPWIDETELLIVTPGIATAQPNVIPRWAREADDELAAAVYKTAMATETFVLPQLFSRPSKEYASDPRAMSLINQRLGEVESTLMIAAIEACGRFLPTVPLLRSTRRSYAALRRMTEAFRARPRMWRRRASSAARDLGRQLDAAVPNFLRADLPNLRGTVKVLSDDPIEFLEVGERPLCLLRPTVRTPVTPGFMLERRIQIADPIYLRPSDFASILVLRGTVPSDPVFPYLEHFVRQIVSSLPGLSLTVVDVRSVDEMALALDRFSGAMAIIDAHGFHPSRSPGKLLFGNQARNVLEAKEWFTPPPIVYLAACDTHAVDRGQETIALGLLVAGVRTVVGTMGPVGAAQSAILCAELLGAVGKLAPSYRTPIRWSKLFWMIAASAHVAEAAIALRSEKLISISPRDVNSLHASAVLMLLEGRADWLQLAQDELAKAAQISPVTVREMWRTFAHVTDSMLHCQLGHADSVFLTSDEWEQQLAMPPGGQR
jgi:hypothetical protein